MLYFSYDALLSYRNLDRKRDALIAGNENTIASGQSGIGTAFGLRNIATTWNVDRPINKISPFA
jgi:hypothetical protein